MKCSWQESWSWLPFLTPGDLPDPGLKPQPVSPDLAADSLLLGLLCCCCSVTKSCRILCSSKDFSMPGFPGPRYLLGFAQTHVRWVVMPSNHLILRRPLLLLPPWKALFISYGYFIDISWSEQSTGVQACLLYPSFEIGLQHLSDNVFKSHDFLHLLWSAWKHLFFCENSIFSYVKMRIELTVWNKYNSVSLLKIKQIYMLT